MLDFSSLAESGVMVVADGFREKVFARGPRWVSLSSKRGFISTPVPKSIEGTPAGALVSVKLTNAATAGIQCMHCPGRKLEDHHSLFVNFQDIMMVLLVVGDPQNEMLVVEHFRERGDGEPGTLWVRRLAE